MISLNISTDRKQWYKISLDEQSNFPLTFSIQDIKDFSKRKGSGSKTIIVANTKENHIALEHIFDNKNDTMRFVKKKCYCQIIQDDVVILDNQYFRIEEAIIVNDVITYKAKIFNELTNFYSDLDGKLLSDLDLSKYNHTYNASTIVNSFNHTYNDGYKYTLPYNYNNETSYYTKDLYPAIYTRTYFDKIHEQAGYRYKFEQMDDSNIRFNKLIHPFNGDVKKILGTDYDYNTIVSKNTNTSIFNVPTVDINNGATSKTSNFALLPTDYIDPKNLWNNTEYFTVPGTISNPQKYEFIIQLDWKLVIDNILSFPIKNSLASYHIVTSDSIDVYLEIMKQNGNVLVSKRLTGDIEQTVTTHNGPALTDDNDKYYINGPIYINSNTEQTLLSNSSYIPITLTVEEATKNEKLKANIKIVYKRNSSKDFQWALHNNYTIKVNHEYRVDVSKFKIIQNFETDSFLVDAELPINKFIPSGIKQTDYLLSLMQMYNIYAEPDINDEHLIVYKTRDKYYSDGNHLGDMTKYVDFSKDFNIKYLPDVNQKKVILSYNDDNTDNLLKEYKSTTEEIVGEQQIIFDNDNVKGEKKQSLIFSPTLNAITNYNASVPVFPADQRMNMRILLDNGNRTCNKYTIRDNNTTIQYSKVSYPHFSMLDNDKKPTFSIEYGTSQYYTEQIETFTNNNLFYNHFYNMFKQMNSGTLVVCYMKLSEKFINMFKLSDRLIIDNKEYFINQIIDYNPEITYTKVELISSDDVFKIPRIGRKPGNFVSVKPDIDLVNAELTVINTIGTILDNVIEANPTNDDIDIEVDNTVSTIIHTESLQPIQGSITIGDIVSNVRNPIGSIKENKVLYDKLKNINYASSNTAEGSGNIFEQGVVGSFIYGNNTRATKSNTYYIDNVHFKSLNGIDMSRLEREYSEQPYIELTRQDFLDDILPNKIDINDDQYYITDRNLFIKLYNDGKSEEIWRNIECPHTDFYAMNTQKDLYNNKWTYSINDITIYSNKLWICIAPKNADDNAIVSISELDLTYFEPYNGETQYVKINYQYDIVTDIYYTAIDVLKNNILTGLNINPNYSMYTDWNNPNMFNNVAGGGIVNNCAYEIKNNVTVGLMNNNVAYKILNNNATNITNVNSVFEVANNKINGQIVNVKCNRLIENICEYISNVTVSGNIIKNILTGFIGSILEVDNVTHIRYNRCNNITNPTHSSGAIEESLTNK